MSTIVVTSPQCPPASVPCDDQVDTSRDLLDRVFSGADQRRDRYAARPSGVDHVIRRHAQCVGDQLDRMAHRHLEQLPAGVPG
jgi:hypothetical protein